jgi:hypothetical protein
MFDGNFEFSSSETAWLRDWISFEFVDPLTYVHAMLLNRSLPSHPVGNFTLYMVELCVLTNIDATIPILVFFAKEFVNRIASVTARPIKWWAFMHSSGVHGSFTCFGVVIFESSDTFDRILKFIEI